MNNQKLITSKEDKENHGIGFQRVCEVVKERNGIVTRTIDQGVFVVDIVLPIEMLSYWMSMFSMIGRASCNNNESDK